jgi:hypothetical protein
MEADPPGPQQEELRRQVDEATTAVATFERLAAFRQRIATAVAEQQDGSGGAGGEPALGWSALDALLQLGPREGSDETVAQPDDPKAVLDLFNEVERELRAEAAAGVDQSQGGSPREPAVQQDSPSTSEEESSLGSGRESILGSGDELLFGPGEQFPFAYGEDQTFGDHHPTEFDWDYDPMLGLDAETRYAPAGDLPSLPDPANDYAWFGELGGHDDESDNDDSPSDSDSTG